MAEEADELATDTALADETKWATCVASLLSMMQVLQQCNGMLTSAQPEISGQDVAYGNPPDQVARREHQMRSTGGRIHWCTTGAQGLSST